MIERTMSTPVVHKMLFTVLFPMRDPGPRHIPKLKLHSLARKQLSDNDVIETVDHLFRCQKCFETYRFVRASYLKV